MKRSYKKISVLTAIICCVFLFACTDKHEEIYVIPDETKDYPETNISVDRNDTESDSEKEESDVPETVYIAETEIETLPLETEEVIGYTAPEGWYAPRYETGTLGGGDYKLDIGVMGLKVYYVEKKFGMKPATWGYYTQRLFDEVAYYQSRNGLDYSGTVDLATWQSLGFSEKDWNELGTYISPVGIKKSSTRDEIIKVFIDRSKEYLGTPFVVGASGKPGEGVDCSGLALQCMYAIGIYPDGLDPVQHSTIEEYNSRLMWADPKFKQVQAEELLPGDLVFYRRPWSNTVCHVAIYLGENECIEALYSEVEILPLYKEDDGYAIMGFKRVIAN